MKESESGELVYDRNNCEAITIEFLSQEEKLSRNDAFRMIGITLRRTFAIKITNQLNRVRLWNNGCDR